MLVNVALRLGSVEIILACESSSPSTLKPLPIVAARLGRVAVIVLKTSTSVFIVARSLGKPTSKLTMRPAAPVA